METDTRHCRATGSRRVTRSKARLGCGNRHGPLLGNGVTAGHEIGSEAGLWKHTRVVAGQRGHSGSRDRKRGWAVKTMARRCRYLCCLQRCGYSQVFLSLSVRFEALYFKNCIGYVQWRNRREYGHFWH